MHSYGIGLSSQHVPIHPVSAVRRASGRAPKRKRIDLSETEDEEPVVKESVARGRRKKAVPAKVKEPETEDEDEYVQFCQFLARQIIQLVSYFVMAAPHNNA